MPAALITIVVLLVACTGLSGLVYAIIYQTTRSGTPTPHVTPASIPSALTADGHTLFLADWSTNLDNWSGGDEWKWIQRGIIGSDGGQNHQNYGSNPTDYLLMPSYRPTSADYEVDAQIQYVRNTQGSGDFGIVLRVDESNGGYFCGFNGSNYDIALIPNGQSSTTSLLQTTGSRNSVKRDTGYPTERVRIQNNEITLFVDNQQVAQATDSTYLSAGVVGLRANGTVVDVHSFRVESLS